MIQDISALVEEQHCVGPNLYWLKLMLNTQEQVPVYHPGQFSMLSITLDDNFLLRRPFTPLTIEPDGSMTYFYKVLGEGTQRMSRWQSGQQVKILGPLGLPFPQEAVLSETLLIAGGVGVAPMVYLGQWLKSLNFSQFRPQFLLTASERRESSSLVQCPLEVRLIEPILRFELMLSSCSIVTIGDSGRSRFFGRTRGLSDSSFLLLRRRVFETGSSPSCRREFASKASLMKSS